VKIKKRGIIRNTQIHFLCDEQSLHKHLLKHCAWATTARPRYHIPYTHLELFLRIDGDATGAHVDEKEQATNDGQCLEKVVFKEIALGVGRVDSPPVVHCDVEDGEENDEECRSPSGLEAHGDHPASGETNDRDDDTGESPLSLEDNTNEKEDEKHATSQLEVLPAIVVTESGQTSKCALAGDHRIGEDHQQTTYNGEVAEEKVDVEDEPVAETLDEDDTQEASHCDFGVPLRDNAP